MAVTATPANGECFIIMPITVPDHLLETYGSDKNHFTDVLKHLFEPAIRLAGFDPVPPSSDGSRVIHRDIAEKLHNANMVLCDMSALNPNVFFELGMRTAMNKPVCLVRDSALPKLPFDTGPIQCHPYNSDATWQLDDQRKALAKHITATANSPEYKAGKNAWWQVMGVNYAPASIEAGGDTADLNRLKLDQIISMLNTMRKSAAPFPAGVPSLDVTLYRNLVENRLGSMLPNDVTASSWEWVGANNLTLLTRPSLDNLVVKRLCDDAASYGIRLAVDSLKARPRKSTLSGFLDDFPAGGITITGNPEFHGGEPTDD